MDANYTSSAFAVVKAAQLFTKRPITATGVPTGYSAPSIVASLLCTAAGTIELRHGLSASGPVIYTGAMTAGQRHDFAGGDGVRFPNGVYVVVTSGTFLLIGIEGAA